MDNREAKTLLHKYVNDQCTAEELRQVRDILKTGTYQDVWEEVLDETALHFLMNEQSPTLENADRMFRKVEQKITTPTKNENNYGLPKRYVFRVAATISLLLMAAIGFFLANKHDLFQPELVWIQESTTGHQRKGIQLADGTEVWLNTDSQLRFPERFGNATREVYLEGEAFFQVTEDSLRPFVVHTQDIHTTVLGTSFNIDFHDEENLEVTVATGKVKVDQIDSLTENELALAVLTPNQQLTFNQRTHKSDIHEVEAADYLVWREESLVFKDTPMHKVARMLEQYYNQPIAFENDAIQHCQLTATFHRTESFEKVLNTISTISDIRYEIRNHTVYLAGQGCDLAQ